MKYLVYMIVWLGIDILALPQGHSFTDRLILFVWFLVGVAGILFLTRRRKS